MQTHVTDHKWTFVFPARIRLVSMEISAHFGKCIKLESDAAKMLIRTKISLAKLRFNLDFLDKFLF